ncbi:MAG: PGPGW domain-containing protein [Angustibacter sp.]
MPELAEFVLDLDDLDDDQRHEVGRAVLRAITPSATRFQVDIPGGRDDLPQDAVRAAEALRQAAGKTSKDDRQYVLSGWLDARDPQLWDALVTFLPLSYDGDVWDDEGRRIANLHDGEVTFVAVAIAQVPELTAIVGPDRLTPWAEVQTERRAARRAWVRSHPLSVLGWLVVAAGLLLVPLPGPGVLVAFSGVVLVILGSFVARLRRQGQPGQPRPVVPEGSCPDCGHPWWEHAGSGNDRRGMCGECAYEFEHQQRDTDAPGCRCPVPEA